jgi:3',5'-cyclic AMP phosphodiesterase CpdA
MRIVHLSDPHVLSRTAAHWRSVIFNKRLTGFANLLLKRGRVHRREYLLEVMAAATANCDHLVVTGDLTNLALEHEYEEAAALLTDAARRTEVTVVPGNHDIYLPSTHEARRFPHHFGKFFESDLPEMACDLRAGAFPCVKLRGAIVLIALSSAVPRPPFISAGFVGHEQLAALRRILEHPAVRQRLPVILIHHPPVDRRSRLAHLKDGLVDAPALRTSLASLPRGLVLYGHLHLREHQTITTANGSLDAVAASGAALDHPHASVRAGFNVYDVDEAGTMRSIEAHVIDPIRGGFERRPIDRAVAAAAVMRAL